MLAAVDKAQRSDALIAISWHTVLRCCGAERWNNSTASEWRAFCETHRVALVVGAHCVQQLPHHSHRRTAPVQRNQRRFQLTFRRRIVGKALLCQLNSMRSEQSALAVDRLSDTARLALALLHCVFLCLHVRSTTAASCWCITCRFISATHTSALCDCRTACSRS